MDIDKVKTIDEIIEYAAEKEQEASDLYKSLAEKTDRKGVKEMFEDLSKQEAGHKVKVLGLKKGGLPSKPVAQIPDLKISDYLVEETMAPDMTFQELLIFAARKEKMAAELYERLAGMASGTEHRKVFEFLAGQEKAHKLRLENEYEKQVLWEN
jgi:rubrerythrin